MTVAKSEIQIGWDCGQTGAGRVRGIDVISVTEQWALSAILSSGGRKTGIEGENRKFRIASFDVID